MNFAVLVFEAEWVFLPGALLIAAAIGAVGWRLWRLGLPLWELAALMLLRLTVLSIVLWLAARPVDVEKSAPRQHPYVSLLVDRSQSMSLLENNETRYTSMVNFVRQKLAPAVNGMGWEIKPWLFAESATPCQADDIVTAPVDGSRTNLAGAFFQAATAEAEPPMAIIVLTDGVANDNTDNNKAVTALIDRAVPVFAVGFGSDAGPATLALQKVTAPNVAAVKQEFRVSAQIGKSGEGNLQDFNLLLLRDGQLLQTKAVKGFAGARIWTETFAVTETAEGRHNYEVQMSPPNMPELVVGQTSGTAQVDVTNEKDMRILFVQGALTWDYKFILRAIRSDPALRMTGLSRTSDHSTYRQNVEKAGELIDGFPATLDELSPFRIVVISNLKAKDLTPDQQDILTRFCGELGGGVLLIGGSETFDTSWQGTTLEKLLPVTLDPNPGIEGVDQPFHLRLTDDALRSPVFQIAEQSANAAAWTALPSFTHYGRVLSAKLGATVWAEHDSDVGPNGKRILMAEQNYGSGRSAVIAVQNFWRWRLSKDSDPAQFDRFWRQLFRYLGKSNRSGVLIDFTDQEVNPPTDFHMVLERQPETASDVNGVTPSSSAPAPPVAADNYFVVVKGPDQKEVLNQQVQLPVQQQVPVVFHADSEGLYSISIQDSQKIEVAERSVQIVNNRIELERTGRDMTNLQQWASLTGGTAFPEEDLAADFSPLINALRQQIEHAMEGKVTRRPVGLDWPVLTVLLTCLSLEWILRKRWNLL